MEMFWFLWLTVIGSTLVSGAAAKTSLQLQNGDGPDNRLLESNPDVSKRKDVSQGITEATLPTMPTFSFDKDATGDELAPDPADSDSSKDNDLSQRAIASLMFIAAIACVCVVGCIAFVGGMFCWYKHADLSSSARRVLYRSSDSSVLIHNDYQPMADDHETNRNGHVETNNNLKRLAEKMDYPAYGVTGPNPLYNAQGPPIDTNLNRNAEVFHYQQQKQKLKSVNSASSNGSLRGRTSSAVSDPSASVGEENDEENSDGEYTVYECPGPASTTEGPLEIHNPLFADSEAKFLSYNIPPPAGTIESTSYGHLTTVGANG